VARKLDDFGGVFELIIANAAHHSDSDSLLAFSRNSRRHQRNAGSVAHFFVFCENGLKLLDRQIVDRSLTRASGHVSAVSSEDGTNDFGYHVRVAPGQQTNNNRYCEY